MSDQNNTGEEGGERGQGIFVSRYINSLDAKKRLVIPSEWRAQSGSSRLYVLPDVYDKCLCVFPAADIAQRLERIRHHSIGDRKARQFARVLGSQSDLVRWDGQGRIRIKDELLEFADIRDQVVLVGAFDRFELWGPDVLEEVGGMDRGSLQEAAKYVGF